MGSEGIGRRTPRRVGQLQFVLGAISDMSLAPPPSNVCLTLNERCFRSASRGKRTGPTGSGSH